MSDYITVQDSYRNYLNNKKYDENYGTANSTTETDGTNKTTEWNAVFVEEDSNVLGLDSFLKLMVTQLTNQDFMNPVDDTQFISQMAQFSTLQAMSEMSSNMKNNYVLSLVGQEVTCAKFNVSGNLVKETGKVERVTLSDNEFALYVNGEKFTLSQIMELGKKSEAASDADGTDEADEATDGEDAANEIPQEGE